MMGSLSLFTQLHNHTIDRMRDQQRVEARLPRQPFLCEVGERCRRGMLPQERYCWVTVLQGVGVDVNVISSADNDTNDNTVFTTIFKLARGSFERTLACHRVSDSDGVGTAMSLSAVFIASLLFG